VRRAKLIAGNGKTFTTAATARRLAVVGEVVCDNAAALGAQADSPAALAWRPTRF
jgi:hypothetical protein